MKSEPVALRLYKLHRDSLVSYAGRLSGDPVGAEDVVQDAWLLLNRQPQDKTIHEPLGYLKRIVRNLVFSQARRRKNTELVDQNRAAAAEVAYLAEEAPSVEAALIARDDLQRIMALIDELPKRQANAFRMYCFEGMKLREIAMNLGISISLAHILVTDAITLCDEACNRGVE